MGQIRKLQIVSLAGAGGASASTAATAGGNKTGQMLSDGGGLGSGTEISTSASNNNNVYKIKRSQITNINGKL